jgi:hypothetical protein
MIKKVEVNLLTEITFNMENLLKSMIQDAIDRGYTTNEDIIDFIKNEKPNITTFNNNIEGYDALYNDFDSQKEYLYFELGLNPMKDEIKLLINNILQLWNIK